MERARQVREGGGVDERGRPIPAWDEATYRRRAGVSEEAEPVEVPVYGRGDVAGAGEMEDGSEDR
jgi:hypothetical protein